MKLLGSGLLFSSLGTFHTKLRKQTFSLKKTLFFFNYTTQFSWATTSFAI